jgi:branched-chain amino acid transport system substrate-binding protein
MKSSKIRALLRFIHLYLLMSVSVVTCACADPQSAPPLKIGAIYGFTGVANTWSLQARRGIELARDEINDAGGVHGRKLEIVFEDSATTPRGAVTAFNKLVKTDRVHAVIGDIFSFVTLPLVPLAQTNKIVLITPSIFDTDLPTNSDYFFTTCPRKESIIAPVDRFFTLHPDVKRVAIICADNTWGLTYLDVWKTIAEKHKVTVVDQNCISDYSTDMRAEVLRAKTKQPDAVIVAFAIDRALKRMQELQFSPRVLTTSDLDEAIHSRGLSTTEAEGVYFVDWLASDSFQKRFMARFSTAPIMAPQNSYEAVKVVAEGLRLNNNDLQQAIQSLNYSGDIGAVDFGGTRAGNRARATLRVVHNGTIQSVME